MKAQLKAELSTELADTFDAKLALTFAAKDRPRRALSYMSKSEAFNSLRRDDRVSFGVNFFFSLVDGPGKTTAFRTAAPCSSKDENKEHHPYFLRETAKLVKSASNGEAPLQMLQQLFWSKSGHWLKLDDAPGSAGVEPDFALTGRVSGAPVIPDPEAGTKYPASKYAVTVAFEQKKEFTDADQMEAIDYGERLLCIQGGRRVAYTALFHCCVEQKWIRWLRVTSEEHGFRAEVTRPASLSPGEDGQRQLLTVLSLTSAQLGLAFPQVELTEPGSLDILKLLGEGASSEVYLVNYKGHLGALKLLRPGLTSLAGAEAGVLQKLNLSHVPSVPQGMRVAPNAIFFDHVLSPAQRCPSDLVRQIVDCLRSAHEVGVVHRDVRPENIMQGADGKAVLNDWGCSCVGEEKMGDFVFALVPFQGTFRYASDAVLKAAGAGHERKPAPKDDLHSVVRTVIALNSQEVRNQLSALEQGAFGSAHDFWVDWRHRFPAHNAFFDAAESLDYEMVAQVR